jgi:hypothetical protein
VSEDSPPVPAVRPGRFLAGWLNEHSAAAMSSDCYDTWRRASSTVVEVARRSEAPDATEVGAVVWPFEDSEYEAQLHRCDPSIAERSLHLAYVDLTTIYASQVTVATDDPRVRDLGAHRSDREILELCVPLRSVREPAVGFDERANAWIVRSRDSSIEISGRYAGGFEGVDPLAQGFGFIVSAQPSRLLAFTIDNRLVLRDGHHRAVALLARGITRVPALVGVGTLSDFSAHGTLSHQRMSESGAPRLSDYLDDLVSVDMALPRTERVMIFQSTEFELPY